MIEAGHGRYSGVWRSYSARLALAMLLGLAWGGPCGSASAAVPATENPAGAVDPSFASGGVLTASFATSPGPQEGRDAVIQSDGKIVVLTNATTTAGYASFLSRYLPDGEVDASFGAGGSVALPPYHRGGYSAITQDAQGHILVAGSELTAEWQAPDGTLALERTQGVVYRYLADGTPDVSFGAGGKATISVPPPEGLTPGSASNFSMAILTASDGSVTVGGTVKSVCAWYSVPDFAEWQEEYGTFVARLNADGSPDSQFGSSGIVSAHSRCKEEPGAAPEYFGGLAQLASGSVLALADHPEDDTWRFRTYSSTGALSEARTPAEGEIPAQIAMIGTHALVLAGVGSSEVLAEFTSEGVPVSSFGTAGRLSIPSLVCAFGPGCLAVLPDGRILVAGLIWGQVGIRRYLADGTVDTSFGGDGYAWVKPTPVASTEADTVNRLLILHGQPLVVGGAAVPSSYPYPQAALTLFQADGGFSSNPPPPGPGEGPFTPIPQPKEESSSAGSGSGGTSAGGGRGTAETIGRSTETQVDANAINAALAAIVHPRSLPRVIATLRKNGTCRLSFNAPAPGTLVAQWTTLSSRNPHRKHPVIITSGRTSFNAAGRAVIELRLTAAGRALLKKEHGLRLLMRASYMPTGGVAQTTQAALVVR